MTRLKITAKDNAKRMMVQAQGRAAFNALKAIDSNPHRETSIEHHWFEEGWLLEWQVREAMRLQGASS